MKQNSTQHFQDKNVKHKTATTETSTGETEIQPPPQVEIHCILLEKQEHKGSLTRIRAAFAFGCEKVCISVISENYNSVQLHLDHAYTRATIYRLRKSLAQLERCRGHWPPSPDLSRLYPFTASSHKSAEHLPAQIMVTPLPWRDLVSLIGEDISGGLSNSVRLYLCPVDAEALIFDLERSLDDMERSIYW